MNFTGAVLLVLISGCSAWSQKWMIPLHHDFSCEIERSVAASDSAYHTSLKPMARHRFYLDSTKYFEKDTNKYYYRISAKLWRDHLFKIEEEDFLVTIDPIFDFSFTYDFADTSAYQDTVRLWTNTRGVLLQGAIGKTVSFQSSVLENQSYFPQYLRYMVDSLGVKEQLPYYGLVPGFGRTKAFHVSGYDYSLASGWVCVQPWKWMDIQFGHGKNFIGHGYRSVLLSDVAYNYPYLKATAYFFKNKLQYTAIAAQLQTLKRLPLGEVPEALFSKNIGRFHYVSFSPDPRVELGVFEGTVWQRWDSTGVKALPIMAYIPVPGVSSAVNSTSKKHHTVAGANLRIKLNRHSFVYGQFAYDLPNTATAQQVGVRYFGFGLKNLDVQAEWNSTSDYFYSNHETAETFGHMNQPLGYVAGGATQEFIASGSLQHRNFFIRLRFNYLEQKTGNEARLVMADLSDTLSFPLRVVNQYNAETGWTFNRKTNLQLAFGLTERFDRMGLFHRHTSAFYVVFRTALFNKYFDF
ncbi:MAG: hypothetical protein SH856_03520 [Flavobacteriales bacterium]|nr:hypothetical protein [Flavobacteriales bacterium]